MPSGCELSFETLMSPQPRKLGAQLVSTRSKTKLWTSPGQDKLGSGQVYDTSAGAVLALAAVGQVFG